MFLRFVTNLPLAQNIDLTDRPVDRIALQNANVSVGFFRAYDRVMESASAPKWLRAELENEMAWFDRNLRAPKRLTVKRRRFRRRRDLPGVCWFRPEAREHIRRARYVAWLLTEADAPVREIRSRNPGEVIWNDAHQIVATPTA